MLRFVLCSAFPTQKLNFSEFYQNVTNGFQDSTSRAIQRAEVPPNDIVQASLRCQSLQDDKSMTMRYKVGRVEDFQELLERPVQSNLHVFTDGSLELIVNVVRPEWDIGTCRMMSIA